MPTGERRKYQVVGNASKRGLSATEALYHFWRRALRLTGRTVCLRCLGTLGAPTNVQATVEFRAAGVRCCRMPRHHRVNITFALSICPSASASKVSSGPAANSEKPCTNASGILHSFIQVTVPYFCHQPHCLLLVTPASTPTAAPTTPSSRSFRPSTQDTKRLL